MADGADRDEDGLGIFVLVAELHHCGHTRSDLRMAALKAEAHFVQLINIGLTGYAQELQGELFAGQDIEAGRERGELLAAQAFRGGDVDDNLRLSVADE